MNDYEWTPWPVISKHRVWFLVPALLAAAYIGAVLVRQERGFETSGFIETAAVRVGPVNVDGGLVQPSVLAATANSPAFRKALEDAVTIPLPETERESARLSMQSGLSIRAEGRMIVVAFVSANPTLSKSVLDQLMSKLRAEMRKRISSPRVSIERLLNRKDREAALVLAASDGEIQSLLARRGSTAGSPDMAQTRTQIDQALDSRLEAFQRALAAAEENAVDSALQLRRLVESKPTQLRWLPIARTLALLALVWCVLLLLFSIRVDRSA